MQLDKNTIQEFQNTIFSWYENHKRDLAWRNTQDPYAIWISESMLCQTQVSRVKGFHETRMSVFPTVEDLASASTEQVLRYWSGLGYNNRALRLKKAAMEIIAHGAFPSDYTTLITLPGIGDYIANAILAFSKNEDVVVVDTNIRRIMLHWFGDVIEKEEWPESKIIKQLVEQTLPHGKARIRYNALMDYGALELTARKAWIPSLTKQSKFEGSVRQVRSSFVKYLLQQIDRTMTLDSIDLMFPERLDIANILLSMQKDGLIEISGQNIWIKK